jgi:tetratricopeptide (TPR) repeat protein
MSGLALFWILNLLLGSPAGLLLLAILALWYLDNRYLGWLAGLWAPVARAQRIAALRQAVEINPSDVRAMVELGEHYLQAGKPQTAAAYLERAAARGEDGARASYLLGTAWVRLGRYAEGRAKLEAALAQKPNSAFHEPYLSLLEEALATEGPHSARAEELVATLRAFESVEVLTRAGRLCAAAGRKDLAKPLFAEAVQNWRFTPRLMRRRARRWVVRARLGLLQSR